MLGLIFAVAIVVHHRGRRRVVCIHLEIGLKYSWARYYHPGRQRLVSEDPIGFAGGDVNLYGYVASQT
jgi:hypothetical protein